MTTKTSPGRTSNETSRMATWSRSSARSSASRQVRDRACRRSSPRPARRSSRGARTLIVARLARRAVCTRPPSAPRALRRASGRRDQAGLRSAGHGCVRGAAAGAPAEHRVRPACRQGRGRRGEPPVRRRQRHRACRPASGRPSPARSIHWPDADRTRLHLHRRRLDAAPQAATLRRRQPGHRRGHRARSPEARGRDADRAMAAAVAASPAWARALGRSSAPRPWSGWPGPSRRGATSWRAR